MLKLRDVRIAQPAVELAIVFGIDPSKPPLNTWTGSLTTSPGTNPIWVFEANGVEEATYTTNSVSHTFSSSIDRKVKIKAPSDDFNIFISSFELENEDLIGQIPDELRYLNAVSNINIRSNDLSGTIPDGIFQGNIIEDILIAENSTLTGPIPSSIGDASSTLQRLRFENCNLNGTLPAELYDCTSLIAVQINGNAITGGISSDIGDLNSLQTWFCNDNSMSGAIPTTIGNCTSLQNFRIQDNAFTSLPTELQDCLGLTTILAFNNSITTVGAGAFSTQPNLSLIRLENNSLSQSEVDQVLSDCVTSLGVSGRVTATLRLEGNTAPSTAGVTDKNTLIAAGWTVTTD
jgi:hypothetical protein